MQDASSIAASPSPPAWRAFARNALLTVLGLAVGASALHRLPAELTEVTLERRRIEAWRAHCEVLFIGPSYVKAQIIEAEFDAEARRIGRPMRSCKFGGTGVRGTELQVQLYDLLGESWPRLGLVVIDITLGDDPRFEEVNWFKARFIQWHTFRSAWWIAEFYRRNPQAASMKHAGAHVAHLFANYLNLGAGLDALATLGVVARVQAAFGEDVELPISDVHREYLDEQRTWERRKKGQATNYLVAAKGGRHERAIAALVADRASHRERGSYKDRIWPESLHEFVRAGGREAFFLHAPVLRAVRPIETSARHPLVLLDFNDPERFPTLYEPKMRGRTHHVSWYGAREYSKLLAREIAKRWSPAP